MKKILVLYFSGAGATGKIATIMAAVLENYCEVTLLPVDQAADTSLNQYDAFIIGTPVYHGAPAKILTDFIRQMEVLNPARPAFIYNTRGLGSYHTNRILAQRLLKKGILTVLDKEYRSPASDGSLITPFINRFFEFEKNVERKAERACMSFLSMLEKENVVANAYVPRLRLSGIINGPNKLVGQLITFPIYLHKDKCVQCGKCIGCCPCKALINDGNGYPVFQKNRCNNCYRCIHHCPGKALSLSKRKAPQKVLRF